MRFQHLLGAAAPLTMAVLLAACSGSGSSSQSTPTSAGLTYTDPAAAAGWRLVKNASSTATHLVLDLVGPDGQQARGAGFNLRSDGTVKFARFPNGSYVHDLGVLELGNKDGARDFTGAAATTDVYALFGGVKEGGRLLTVGAFQKDRRFTAKDAGRPFLQVAIDFDPATAPATPGAAIALQVVKARHIPGDIGDSPDDPNFNPASIIAKYAILDMPVAVGTLTTQ